MLLPLVLLFIVVPIVEIYVIIQVGQAIGALVRERFPAHQGQVVGCHGPQTRRGLGAKHLRQRRTVELDADPNAQGFYERMGMVHVGDTPSTLVPEPRRKLSLSPTLTSPTMPGWSAREVDSSGWTAG